jgi:hypothetical protein
VNLYYSDNVHPSLEGSYLAAAIIFTTIFKQDPTNLTYTGGVSAGTASTMRAIAYSTVTNSTIYSATLLSNYTPTISVNGNVLTASGSAPYQWYLNGTAIAGATSNTYTATQSGNYQVQTTTTSGGCKVRSFVKYVAVTANGITEESLENFELIPVANNVFDCVSKVMGQISVFDMQGKLIQSFEKTNERVQLDLAGHAHGVYCIVLTNGGAKGSKKIMIN